MSHCSVWSYVVFDAGDEKAVKAKDAVSKLLDDLLWELQVFGLLAALEPNVRDGHAAGAHTRLLVVVLGRGALGRGTGWGGAASREAAWPQCCAMRQAARLGEVSVRAQLHRRQ